MVEEFKIKLATIEDMKDVFDLSNDDIVRKNSFNSEKISWENHQKWFKNKINDKNCIFYVVKDANNFVAQIRVDKISNIQAIISISVSKNYRNKGYGVKLLRSVSDKIININNIEVINAYIKTENIASIKSFEKAGYILKENTKEKMRLEYNAQ